MGLFDALCHPKASDLSQVASSGVSDVMLGGYSAATWGDGSDLMHPALSIWRAFGVHPWVAHEALPSQLAALRHALRTGTPHAIGEIGLDRAVNRDALPAQQTALEAQLELARAHGLSVILHVVRAHGMALERLAQHPVPGGVVHGFSGAAEVARAYLAHGLHISFGGMLLNPRARRVRDAARAVPLDRLIIETDGPSDRLGAGGLPDVLGALAALRSEPVDVLAQATAENARRAYQL